MSRRRPGLHSLRWRLAALIGAVVVLAVAGTFAVIYNGTGTQLRHQIERDVRADAQAFDRGGVPGRTARDGEIEETARRYLRSQPYRTSNRLLLLRIGTRAPCSRRRPATPTCTWATATWWSTARSRAAPAARSGR